MWYGTPEWKGEEFEGRYGCEIVCVGEMEVGWGTTAAAGPTFGVENTRGLLSCGVSATYFSASSLETELTRLSLRTVPSPPEPEAQREEERMGSGSFHTRRSELDVRGGDESSGGIRSRRRNEGRRWRSRSVDGLLVGGSSSLVSPGGRGVADSGT